MDEGLLLVRKRDVWLFSQLEIWDRICWILLSFQEMRESIYNPKEEPWRLFGRSCNWPSCMNTVALLDGDISVRESSEPFLYRNL